MAFTQVPISGTIKLPNNSAAAAGAIVTFSLNAAMTDGTILISPSPVSVVCDATGAFTVTLPANDDTTTTPTGTYYQVTLASAAAPFVALDTFNISVPKASSGGVNLFTLATLLNPSSVSAFVSQIVAGTGVTISPVGGTGAVTINSTGGGGGSFNATVVTSAGTVSHPTELLDATSAAFTRTLPTAVGFTGMYILQAITSTANLVTLATTSGQTIDGFASGVLALGTAASGAPFSTVNLVSDNANWRIV